MSALAGWMAHSGVLGSRFGVGGVCGGSESGRLAVGLGLAAWVLGMIEVIIPGKGGLFWQ